MSIGMNSACRHRIVAHPVNYIIGVRTFHSVDEVPLSSPGMKVLSILASRLTLVDLGLLLSSVFDSLLDISAVYNSGNPHISLRIVDLRRLLKQNVSNYSASHASEQTKTGHTDNRLASRNGPFWALRSQG